jgi:hypothetical protein
VKLALSLAAAVAAVLSSLLVVPVATVDAATPSVSVQWPEVTRFNPATYAYDAVVTNNGTRNLFVTFDNYDGRVMRGPLTVPKSGHLTLPWEGNTVVVIHIWACVGDYRYWDGSCTEVASSPKLTVYTHLKLVSHAELGGNVMKSGRNIVKVGFSPGEPEIARPSATWELLGPDSQPLTRPVTGSIPSASLVPGADGFADLPIDIPAGVPDGDYLLDVRMSVDDPLLGHLDGSLGEEDEYGFTGLAAVRLDTVAPRVRVTNLPTVFYPVVDDYRDSLTIVPTYSEGGAVRLEVLNSAGARVYRISADSVALDLTWNGRNAQDRPVAPGTYTLRLTVTDEAGNSGFWTGRTMVSHKKVQFTTWKRTVTAAPYVSSTFVGKCSVLKRKAHGALGFYSQKKCRGGDRASTVVAYFGMRIPRAIDDKYGWGELRVHGGPATSSKRNYLIAGFIKPDGSLVGRRQLGSDSKHSRPVALLNNVVHDRTQSRPYVIWSNGLTAGSRYDVRSFTISIDYQVLR